MPGYVLFLLYFDTCGSNIVLAKLWEQEVSISYVLLDECLIYVTIFTLLFLSILIVLLLD